MVASCPANRWPLLALLGGLLWHGAAGTVEGQTAQLHDNTGLAYYYQGKNDLAYEEFVKALELDPSLAGPHFNLGRLFERQAKYTEALQQYRQALELDPAQEEALKAVERLQGQPALVAGAGSPGRGPSDAEITKDAAAIQAAFEQGDKKAARERLDRVLAATPNAPPYLLVLAQQEEKNGNIAGALSALQKARTAATASPDIATKLALVLYRAGLFDQAAQEAERALDLNPTLAPPYRILGLVMLSRQKPVEANAYFVEAARLDPKDEISRAQVTRLGKQLGLLHYNSGLFYFQQQDWIRCKDELEQAIAQGNLTPEQSALAQQYLIIAEFSAARVAQQLRKLQDDRKNEQAGRVGKTLTFPEIENSPTIWRRGAHIEYSGYIVGLSAEGAGTEILVTRNVNELIFRERGGGSGENDQSFRTNTEMTNWFVIQTPKPLPIDPRVRATSRIRVQGQLGEPRTARNPYNLSFSRKPLPTVMATYVEINRELRQTRRRDLSRQADELGRDSSSRRDPLQTRAPQPFIDTDPGLSGPLKIDYLQIPAPKRKLAGS